MDSIFDEDVDEVGGEIEAYCPSPRCKADTTHTIISMYEDEVRRVQCVVCGEVHAYRKPRGDAPEEGSAEPSGRKPSTSPRISWKDAVSRATEPDLGNSRSYSIRDTYEIGDVVAHPKFDIGFVTELLPVHKVAMVFRDEAEPRILVHNRGDLAPSMPGISEIPPPRDVAYAGTIRLDIDATNLSQRIFKIRQTIPAQAGTLTLLYPMWVPGGHSPRNAIDKIAGLTFKANGTKLEWKRDPLDVAAFHVTVPEGVSEILSLIHISEPTRPY